MGRLRAADIGRRFDFAQKETPAVGKPTAGVIVADRVGFEPTSRLRDYLISSFLHQYYFIGFFIYVLGCFIRRKSV